MKTRKLKHAWNCCQNCGSELEMGKPASGELVPADEIVEDANGRKVTYIYTHQGRCPKKGS